MLDIVMAQNVFSPQYEILGFIDEESDQWGKSLNGYPVLGGFDWFGGQDKSEFRLICAVGNPAVRRKLVQKAAALNLQFCNIIHPTAVMTPFVELGEGVVVTAGSIFTNHIKVGNHVHINLDCTIGHDCVIQDFATIDPGVHISGNVHIKTGCYIGTGAVVIQGMVIGEWSVVGAGTVVLKDIPPNTTSVGVPARVINEREVGWHEQ
ncbi:acetyltransferase [Acidobacteria bacterium AH-259-A15]|nr:acetyltransferase [Acidobacteria bacterium AH-259-A15]